MVMVRVAVALWRAGPLALAVALDDLKLNNYERAKTLIRHR
jgi:hypothetical protein